MVSEIFKDKKTLKELRILSHNQGWRIIGIKCTYQGNCISYELLSLNAFNAQDKIQQACVCSHVSQQ